MVPLTAIFFSVTLTGQDSSTLSEEFISVSTSLLPFLSPVVLQLSEVSWVGSQQLIYQEIGLMRSQAALQQLGQENRQRTGSCKMSKWWWLCWGRRRGKKAIKSLRVRGRKVTAELQERVWGKKKGFKRAEVRLRSLCRICYQHMVKYVKRWAPHLTVCW